jgi:hypothetical protein
MTTLNHIGGTRYLSRIAFAFSLVAILSATAPTALAIPFTLNDDNSTASGDTATIGGLTDWTVDGVSQLKQQWFWYRIGDEPEVSVSTLAVIAPSPILTDTNGDDQNDTLFVRYAPDGGGFSIDVRLTLDGGAGGSGASDLGEQISIHNNSRSPLEFHFYQYADFDLNGTPEGDSVFFANANAVRQFEGTLRLTETVVTPLPSHREAAVYPVTLTKLLDGNPTVLSDTPADNVIVGPDDVTWAYQWDVIIEPGGTFQISKDKNLNAVPEPGTVVLASLAFGTLVFFGRRRSR